MKLSRVIIPAVFFFALDTVAPAAIAQDRQGDRRDREQQAQGEQQRGQNQQGRARGQQRGQQDQRGQAPRDQSRTQDNRQGQAERRTSPVQGEPAGRRGNAYGNVRGDEQSRREVGTRGVAVPPAYRRSDRYDHAYYNFRPRTRIGVGIWIGYPVEYPSYGVYPPPVVYGGPDGAVATYGGVSFEITPPDADVYVDGGYAGRVGQFTPNAPPLALAPGSHRIELDAQGYDPIVFDVNVAPGEVIPYQGTMQPAY